MSTDHWRGLLTASGSDDDEEEENKKDRRGVDEEDTQVGAPREVELRTTRALPPLPLLVHIPHEHVDQTDVTIGREMLDRHLSTLSTLSTTNTLVSIPERRRLEKQRRKRLLASARSSSSAPDDVTTAASPSSGSSSLSTPSACSPLTPTTIPTLRPHQRAPTPRAASGSNAAPARPPALRRLPTLMQADLCASFTTFRFKQSRYTQRAGCLSVNLVYLFILPMHLVS